MTRFLQHLRFRTKLIMIFGLVCVIPLSAEMILSYRISAQNTFGITEEYTVTNMNVVCEEIDGIFKRANAVCDELENSVNIQEYLRKDFSDTAERYSYDLKVSMELLNQYSSSQDIFGVYVLGKNGAQYKSNYNSFRIVNFAEQDWYETLCQTGKSVWFLPHKGSYVVKSEMKNFVSLGKMLMDKASGNMSGVVIVEIDENMITSLLDRYEGSRNGFFVVDEKGNVIFKSSFYDDGIQADFQAIAAKETDHAQNQYYRLCGKQYLVSGRELSNGLWSIYSLISVDQINATASGTLLVNCMILLCSVVLMLFLIFWASAGITRPIARLSAGMQEIRSGNLNVSVKPEETKDEIGLLIDDFNRMSATMNEMNEKIYEKQRSLQKAEMKALQAQINPHFLYNSLDSVTWLLRLNKKEEAITMVGALSKLFKAVLSKGKEYIPIADEICHVENYLLIQKIRYRNKFRYEMHVEDGVMQYRTVKLILQPLVENAIYHGIRGEVESEEILVSVYERGAQIVFQVSDTGKGMEEAQLKMLRENVKMLRETTDSYGLKNIYERIQIYYAGRADMTIDSEPDRGTIISICIPKENAGI